MSITDVTLTDENSDQEIQYSMVRVRDVDYKLDINTDIWTSGPVKFAQVPAWARNGAIRPPNKRGLPSSNNTKWLRKMDPFRNFQIFPSVDPYTAEQRQLFRILNQENPWVARAQQIIQKLVVREFTTEMIPRGVSEEDMSPEQLKQWQDTPLEDTPPFFDHKEEGVTPNQIKAFIDKMAKTLDLKDIIFDAYMFAREQGRTAIGMFPEGRDPDTGKYVMPQALRLLRPELLRRPIVNFDTSELVAVEVTGLTSNGSRFDANRLIYIIKSKNLELFSDFYGRSDIRPILDVGKVLLVLYSRDYLAASINTWHTPYIFKHNVPGKDFSQIKTIMDNFNVDLANNAGKDISVSYNVELMNPSGSNPGDIAGLVNIENQCIDTIAGYNNIPPFMFAKGKAGRLGGNANREEIDSFIQTEIEPEQEMLEQVIERQFYDRILSVIYDVEPRDVGTVPIMMKHNFETPQIQTEVDPAQFNMMMNLVDREMTTPQDAMDKLGLGDILKGESSSIGGDVSPSVKTWPVGADFDLPKRQMMDKKLELLDAAKEALKRNNNRNEPESDRTAV